MRKEKNKNSGKIKASIAFTPEINAMLKFVAAKEQRSMRSIICIVVTEYLQSYIADHIEKFGEGNGDPVQDQDPKALIDRLKKQEEFFLKERLRKQAEAQEAEAACVKDIFEKVVEKEIEDAEEAKHLKEMVDIQG